jgi:hypothetical protein
MGWWANPRREKTLFMLIISEIAEAMEGARKECPDDKLPHREMMEVELADTFIRCCDFIGFEQTQGQCSEGSEFDQDVMEDELRSLRGHLSEDVGCRLYDLVQSVINVQQCYMTWERLLAEIIAVAEMNEFDLFGAIEEKLEFNRTRADHQIENREKDGGKKW